MDVNRLLLALHPSSVCEATSPGEAAPPPEPLQGMQANPLCPFGSVPRSRGLLGYQRWRCLWHWGHRNVQPQLAAPAGESWARGSCGGVVNFCCCSRFLLQEGSSLHTISRAVSSDEKSRGCGQVASSAWDQCLLWCATYNGLWNS